MSPSHWPIKAGGTDVSGSDSNPRHNEPQWWPFAAGESADWLRVQSPALAPPTKTSRAMIAAIARAARTRRTPYEALKSAVFRCFMMMKLTAVSEPERVIRYEVQTLGQM